MMFIIAIFVVGASLNSSAPLFDLSILYYSGSGAELKKNVFL